MASINAVPRCHSLPRIHPRSSRVASPDPTRSKASCRCASERCHPQLKRRALPQPRSLLGGPSAVMCSCAVPPWPRCCLSCSVGASASAATPGRASEKLIQYRALRSTPQATAPDRVRALEGVDVSHCSVVPTARRIPNGATNWWRLFMPQAGGMSSVGES